MTTGQGYTGELFPELHVRSLHQNTMNTVLWESLSQLSLNLTDRIFPCSRKYYNVSFRMWWSYICPSKRLYFYAQARLWTQMFWGITFYAANNSSNFILLITLGMESKSLANFIFTKAYISRHNVAKNFSGGNDLLIVKYIHLLSPKMKYSILLRQMN